MSGYVRAGDGTNTEPWRTDYPADPDEIRKQRAEEHDIENDIPTDWAGDAW